jgi:DNA-binding transcriptional MocR family regulator
MTKYQDLSIDELRTLHDDLEQEYRGWRAKDLELNMARGKPSAAQLELSLPILDVLNSKSNLTASDGTDCRNYGVLLGLPEARALLGAMVGARPEQVIVGGASSLNLMYDTSARAWTHGIAGCEPWGRQEKVKFLCPSPGYDRHFGICEHFGIEMIPIEMSDEGPDMFTVKKLVQGDPAVKGIWCVPQYSNPQGYTYSDGTVRAFAALKPAAPDFRVFWDNAYVVHHLYGPNKRDHVLNILDECEKAGNPDLVFEFCSTSKVTFPGAGIAALVTSEANVARIAKAMSVQTIGFDKLNQLRHVRFLKDARGIEEHMAKHAELLRPKFELVERIFEEDLGETGIGTWTKPRGGYFISYVGMEGTAKQTVQMAANAGVKLTGAGATWPLHQDPHDADIRIAPSLPPLEELEQAARVFTLCARIVTIEKLLLS